jgi:RecA-family ATPase
VGLLVSEGGIGKTFAALELAFSVATGEDFYGLPTHRGAVVYMGFEDPPDEIRRRMYRIHERRHDALVRAGEVKRAARLKRWLFQNFHAVSLAGKQLHLTALEKNVAVQTPALHALIEKLRGVGPLELVILDPMARLHGADENANATGTVIINAAERISRELNCTVLILHHTGKASAARDDAYAARGASGIADAARVVLRLRACNEVELKRLGNVSEEEAARGVLKLIHAKSNYSPRVNDLWLKRNESGGFVAFSPTFKDADDDYATALARLRAWWVAQPRGTAITQRTVRRDHSSMLIGSGRNEALRFFNDAVQRGDLRPTGEVRRGGGALYTLVNKRKGETDEEG